MTNSQNLLKKFFGYDNFRPGQEEIINNILNQTFKNSNIETGEIGLPTTEKLILPCGIYGKITKN